MILGLGSGSFDRMERSYLCQLRRPLWLRRLSQDRQARWVYSTIAASALSLPRIPCRHHPPGIGFEDEKAPTLHTGLDLFDTPCIHDMMQE